MHNLIVNGKGLVADHLTQRLIAKGQEVDVWELDADVQEQFSQALKLGKTYSNIFISALEIGSELESFSEEPVAAIDIIETRLCNFLKFLKYGAQAMARGNGGAIWVLCSDQGISYSLKSPANPVVNLALVAAVKSLAREVHRLGVTINLFMTHPVAEAFERSEWIAARDGLKFFDLKYKPQPVAALVEFIQGYSELKNPYITGAVISAGTGLVEHNI